MPFIGRFPLPFFDDIPKMTIKLDAPRANRFMAYANAPESQLFLNVSVTVIKAVVYPYGLANNRHWKTVPASAVDKVIGNSLFFPYPIVQSIF